MDLSSELLRCLIAEVRALRRAVETPGFAPPQPELPIKALAPEIVYREKTISPPTSLQPVDVPLVPTSSAGDPGEIKAALMRLSDQSEEIISMLGLVVAGALGPNGPRPALRPQIVTIPDGESVRLLAADAEQLRIVGVLSLGYSSGSVHVGLPDLKPASANGVIDIVPYNETHMFILEPGISLWGVNATAGGVGYAGVMSMSASQVRNLGRQFLGK